jgi:tetratricopeptide (TPR) repeat protein
MDPLITASVDDLVKLAKEELSRNQLSMAEKSLEQAILINNQVPDAYNLLGYIYSKKGKFKKAILAFERALQLDPFHTESAIALSSLYNDVGKYKEGAQIYFKTKKRLENVLPGFDPKINKTLSDKHYELGLFYLRFERFQEAHHEFAKTCALNSSHIQGHVQMARCLQKMGNKQGAIELLLKLLVIAPNNIDAKINLGILYHSQQRLSEAKKYWLEALSSDPENKSAQMYLSMLEQELRPSLHP